MGDCDQCNKLKDAYTNILQDNVYLCERSIVKSKILLASLEDLDQSKVQSLNTELQKLLERMTLNLNSFKERFGGAAGGYKCSRGNGSLRGSPKSRHILSLKRNGEKEETDMELSQDLASTTIKLNTSITISDSKSDISVGEEKVDLIDENEDGQESDDSQKTIPYSNFDVCTNGLKEGEDDKKQLGEALNMFISQDAQAETSKADDDLESSSFDFDDDSDDSQIKLEPTLNDEDFRKEAQKNNYELLELLIKRTEEDPNYPQYATTEHEADEALQCLDDDSSLSLYTDSDDSNNWSLNESEESDADVEELGEEEPQVAVVVALRLTRVDDLDDAAIDRLCDLNNLNKRKCKKALKSRKRYKRLRLLSASSTESLSESSSSSDGSTTPDINLDELHEAVGCDKVDVPGDVTALADEFCDKLTDSGDEFQSSSGSETDIEEKPSKEKKVKDKTKATENTKEETDSEDEEEKKKRRPISPLLRGSLWTDSSDDFESDTEKKPKMKFERSEIKASVFEDPTVISSDSSISSDDVTFVSEGSHDGNVSGRGRRNIRAIINESELNELTQRAKDDEIQRIHRLEEHSKCLEPILSQQEDFVLDVQNNKPVITVSSALAKRLKPHQKNGVKFMWEACYESVEALNNANPGNGCILAHCMGLGKTYQVVTLVHTLLTHEVTKTKHVMIVCPLSTVSNWQNEFKLAFEEVLDRKPNIKCHFLLNQSTDAKVGIVKRWGREGGVIVMGYETFQSLSTEKNKQIPETRKKLREILLDPGPDLVVCDEGHLLKNGNSSRTRSLMRVKTKRRIALTGTPLQNNLIEYYYMVNFVKEHLLGTDTEYTNRFVNPIMNGQYENSTDEDIKLMKKRTHVLTKLLKKTIDRVETRVLEQYLPEIQDYTILVKLEPLQIELYKRYVNPMRRTENPKNGAFFQDFRITKLITLHPWAIQICYDILKSKTKKKEVETINQDPDEDENANNVKLKEGWYEDLLPEDVDRNVDYSAKMKLLLRIVNETVKNDEKALIFAHYLPELDCVEKLLEKAGTKDYPIWRSGVDFFRMDGCVKPEERSKLCARFNTDPRVKVFLISHKVGGLGLNLTAANRVILIGSNHNPSVDVQSIYRVYRFGQEKKVFVYRLLSLGTMEERVYRRCVVKEAVAGTVVDKFHFGRPYKTSDLQQMYQCDFETVDDRPIPSVPSDMLLANLLLASEDIYSYHHHKALLENRPEEELNDEEKKLAWDEWDAENANVAAPPPIVSVTAPPPLLNSTLPLTRHRPSPLILDKSLFAPNPKLRFNLTRLPFQRPPPAMNNGPPSFNQYRGPRMNNAPDIVFNPISLKPRGPAPRSLVVPNLPRAQTSHNTTMPQTGRHILPPVASMYSPSFNGYNRNVPRNPVTPSNNNQLLRLINSNRQDNVDRYQSVIRANPAATPRTNQEVPSAGEFNYALNKFVH